MKYDIWVEGYLYTGMEGIPAKAKCLATDVEGDTFLDAVRKWYDSVPNAEYKYGHLSIDGDGATLWGCKLYDNETDARKSFG